MFLDRAAELQLLPHSPDTDILRSFPLPVQKRCIWDIVQCLSPSSILVADPTQILSSPSHVTWAMELIGCGFTLPIEDASIISECIVIYSAWFLDPAKRPVGLREHAGSDFEQTVWQNMFKHISLLFQPRKSQSLPILQRSGHDDALPSSESLTAQHVNLCHRALSLTVNATTLLAASFTGHTWSIVLKVVLAAADVLLCYPSVTDPGTAMGAGTTQPGSGGSSALSGIVGRAHLLREKFASSGTVPDHLGTIERANADDHGARMGDELCEHLVQVLLSLWFKSEILDVGMWNKLAARFPKWTHRKDIIQYWSGAIAGLTQRVVRRLYGPSEGSPFLSVSVKSFTAQFDVSEKFLVYAWHRMIYIIGNVNQIEDSQNYDLAIKGVARVVDIMHAVGTKDFHEESDGDLPPAPAPIIRPDGNSILTLFGPWLFQASGRHSPEFEDGKAEAVATLCRIFSLPQRPSHSFTRTNLASFYTVLRGALHANPISLAAALHGCTTLFLQNLPGLRALVPDVIAGVRRVLPGEQKSTNGKISLESEALRRTALKVVACVLALLNHFDGVPVRDKESALLVTTPPSARVEPEESPTMMRIRVHYAHSEENLHVKPATNPLDPETTFVALKPFLLDTLIASLVVESSPTNCKQILHLLCCFAFEDVGFCPSVPSLAIGAIRDRIVAKAWPPEVVFSAMDCLSHLTLVWEYVNHSTKSCSRELVLSLCAYIDSLFQGDNIVANQNLIIEAYNCMVRWTLVGGWILDDKDCLKVVVACLSRGVALLDKDDDFGVVTPISPSSSSPQHPAIGLTNTLAPKSSSDKASSDKGGLTLPATDRPSTASIGSTTASAIANHFANMVAGSSERSGTSAGAGGGSSLSGSSGSSSSSARKGRHPRLFLRARGSIVVGASASSAGSALLNAAANAGLLSPVLLNLPGPGSSSASSTMTIHNDAAKTSGGPSMMNSTNATAVSTGTRDGGLGLPTFAVLTSQVTIKAAAEIGLSQISNYLGNFPPAAAGAGVSRLSTLWDEVSEAKRILEKRQNMLKENSSQSSDIGKYLRYFAYDGRVIIGMVEQPEWAQEPADQSQRRHSSGANLILVLRDFTGKYAWKTSLRYLEEKSPTSNSLCPPSVQDSSTPTSSASSEGSSLQVSQPSVQLSVTSPTDDPTLSMSEVGSLSNSRSFAQNVATSPPESATPSGRLRTLRPSSAPSHLRSSELQADKLRRKALLTHHNLLHAHPQPDQQSSIQETQGGGHTRSASQELLHPPLETPRRPASAMSTSSHNSIHAAPLGPKMDRRSYKPFSVRPRSAPQLPPNSSILTVKAHNESEGAIPTLETLASGSPSFEKIKTVTKRHAVLEEASWNRAERCGPMLDDTKVLPPLPIDRMNPLLSSTTFRLFLAHIGYLHVDYREKLRPLPITESLLKDLEKCDSLPERECIAITVLPTTDPSDTLSTILESQTPPDFDIFLQTMGWNVSLSEPNPHRGFLGGLTPTVATSATYFASRTIEVVFHSPVGLVGQDSGAKLTALSKVAGDNLVAVIWVEHQAVRGSPEDPGYWRRLLGRILGPMAAPASASASKPTSSSAHASCGGPHICILVQPQALATPGLYVVRIFGRGAIVAAGLAAASAEDEWTALSGTTLAFGPLSDGMVVSRHTVGVLVRVTAIYAHLHCRSVKGGYRKPQTARRLMIEDICSKQKVNQSMASFYSSLFLSAPPPANAPQPTLESK